MHAVDGELAEGTTSVGYRVQLDHLAPTAVGGKVRAEATLETDRGPPPHVPGLGERRPRPRRRRPHHPGRRRARPLPGEGRRGPDRRQLGRGTRRARRTRPAGSRTAVSARRRGSPRAGRSGIASAISESTARGTCASSSPTITERGHAHRRELGELVGLPVTISARACSTSPATASPTCVGVLAEAGPFGEHPLVRRRPERVELVEQRRSTAMPFSGARPPAPKRDELGVDAGRRPRGRVHEHAARRAGRGGRARPGASPCRPSSARAAGRSSQLERVGHRQHVGGEPVERVGRRVVGLVALAVPAVVEGDHPMVRARARRGGRRSPPWRRRSRVRGAASGHRRRIG